MDDEHMSRYWDRLAELYGVPICRDRSGSVDLDCYRRRAQQARTEFNAALGHKLAEWMRRLMERFAAGGGAHWDSRHAFEKPGMQLLSELSCHAQAARQSGAQAGEPNEKVARVTATKASEAGPRTRLRLVVVAGDE